MVTRAFINTRQYTERGQLQCQLLLVVRVFSCVFRICTRAISILSILAFLMTVDARNKLRWSYLSL